ncbi:tripartite tricarboxylate transporter substrate binding protein [Thalassospiraceae bacterium LMO-JJ14]|nr:tripartite tricarboxylate transporter substrate binding protein [Thalassospiraceae bacterium LMO-JJ14]
MKNIKRQLTATAGAFAFAAAMMIGGTASAEFPDSTIHLVVPWKAGGGTDTIVRGYQKAFEKAAGVTVVIDNINGAKSVTGTLKVAKAKGDGYTILFNGSLDVTSNLAMKPLPYDVSSFKAVGGVYTTPTWFITNVKRPYKDFQDFLDAAKANPGKLSMGTAGSTHTLVAHAVKGATGLNFKIVPFSGGADLKKALIGDEVDIGQFHSPVMINEIKAGIIRPLVATAPMGGINYAPAQNLKTLKDYGIDLNLAATRGLMVPKSTPDAIVAKLEAIAKEASMDPSFAEFGKTFGFAPVWVSAADYGKQHEDEVKLLKEIKSKYID